MHLHFGSISNYERFIYSYFIAETSDNDTVYKHIITHVQYSPDSVYKNTDGHAGYSWVVTIRNNDTDTTHEYRINNWCELIKIYENQGLVFVDESNKK
jgi:hypothetical protein